MNRIPPTGARQDTGLRLLADIGGTNARFALARQGKPPHAAHLLRTKEYRGPAEAIAAYLRLKARVRLPTAGAIAVAGPIQGDAVSFTNAPWKFSIRDLRRETGIAALAVLNDFEALAWALPAFGRADVLKFGQGRPVKGAPLVALGPGTGLGVGCFLPGADFALATEAGHISLAAGNPREASVIAVLAQRFGHVSAERVVSGPGLRYVYEALAAIDGAPPFDADAIGVAAVTGRARTGEDPLAVETVRMFSSLFGSFAGDMALAYGARGGVYIGAGVIPRLGPMFDRRAFRRRFTDKGRFHGWLARIPTYLVVHPQQTMVGLAQYLDRQDAPTRRTGS
ncbi:MAG: glucokinase [Alphaproteobacteria bacterium]|nr:glucokinase [Alphaproteobacteria bacterium]